MKSLMATATSGSLYLMVFKVSTKRLAYNLCPEETMINITSKYEAIRENVPAMLVDSQKEIGLVIKGLDLRMDSQ